MNFNCKLLEPISMRIANDNQDCFKDIIRYESLLYTTLCSELHVITEVVLYRILSNEIRS